MAKKAGAQKIQEEINTDEELERFLDRPGLLGQEDSFINIYKKKTFLNKFI